MFRSVGSSSSYLLYLIPLAAMAALIVYLNYAEPQTTHTFVIQQRQVACNIATELPEDCAREQRQAQRSKPSKNRNYIP